MMKDCDKSDFRRRIEQRYGNPDKSPTALETSAEAQRMAAQSLKSIEVATTVIALFLGIIALLLLCGLLRYLAIV